MENQYWIIDDAIIFKQEFNENLDNYIDIKEESILSSFD